LANSENENLKDVLLHLYDQCWEDKRNYDRMIWQTPAISLAIVAVIAAGLAGTRITKAPVEVLVALVFGLSVTVVGIVQLKKHRFFSIAATGYLQRIQDSIRDMKNGILSERERNIVPNIVFRTQELSESGIDVPKGWLAERIAYNWLFGLMYAVMIGLTVAIAWVIFTVVRAC
jgi:hypothetical protein